MKHLTLENGDHMPILGLGTWNSEDSSIYNAVKEALKMGYRHIDCAAIYGNEKQVGQAINDSVKEDIVNRESLWITSKLWSNAHGRENVIPTLQKTLSDLQLEYLDLYEIHWPVPLKNGVSFAEKSEDFAIKEHPIPDTWRGMEDAHKKGLTRHIGVSNFSIPKLKSLLEFAEISPEMNQVELHAYLQQNALVEFCKSVDIHVTAYAPLGSSGRPDSLKTEGETVLLQDPIIKEIANKKGGTPAQILLSWITSRGIAAIPKSTKISRLKENIDSKNITLSEEDMETIKSIDKNHRYINGNFWIIDNGPITLSNLWN